MSTAPRNLWLVRHGNRLDFTNPEWLTTAARRHDPPLSPDGAVQARQTGQRLRQEKIDHVIASPFLRAVETASHIADAIDRPIRIEHGLCEAFFENWFPVRPDFIANTELARSFPRVDPGYASAVQPLYPESQADLRLRASRTVDAILNAFDGNLLLVAHGGSISALATALLPDHAGVHTACCCLIRFAGLPGQWTLLANGADTSHLSQSEDTIRLA